MRLKMGLSVMVCLASAAACQRAPLQPPTTDTAGNVRYNVTKSEGRAVCNGRPVQIDGDHGVITLTGPCRSVAITGSHVDAVIDVVAGGTIDVYGEHDDIFWRTVGTGPRPNTLDHGSANTFHKRTNEN